MHPDLRKKLDQDQIVGAVVGLGYVGLPLVQHLCDASYIVLGFDNDDKKIEKLLGGESYIHHIAPAWISDRISSRRFLPTSDYARLAEADCISICVPTPLSEHFEPDLRFVCGTAEEIAIRLRPGQLIILESTTYPGTTTEVLVPILERGGLTIGRDIHLAYSPEREDPGNPSYAIKNIPKIIGGVTTECAAAASRYYGAVFDRIVTVSTPAAAELTKLLENIFRSVNIALVNELKMLCDRMSIDIWEVIDAAATKPFGFMPFFPGPGLGGHCIPIDPFYLSWKAREFEFSTRFIELAGQINTMMPHYVVSKMLDAFNDRGKALKGAHILVLGVAYKKDVDDVRESPGLKLIEILKERGSLVDYHDPFVPAVSPTRKHRFEMKSVPLTSDRLEQYDCVLIATDHSSIDYSFVVEHAPLIIDTRHATKEVVLGRDKIVMA